ncbi:uncharacterized protein METZ01_LOCUS188925, partial [marine metagenome]
MINMESLEMVQNSIFGNQFTKPLYDTYCFSNIPSTVKKALGVDFLQPLPEKILSGMPEKFEKVILFYLDAFGWKNMERHLEV